MSFHVQREPWMTEAKCRGTDPNLFFPDGPGVSNTTITTAKKVCAECPVRLECLEYANRLHIFDGVWGGLSVTERRGYTRKSRRGAA